MRTRDSSQLDAQHRRLATLGRMAGDVAHDFNNLLGVISNSAHLIARHCAAGDLETALSAVRQAVETGAERTRDLLRFAAQRPFAPQRLDLSRFLPELHDSMGRLVGQRIQITIDVAPSTAPVHADPRELELALINLALDARDAMPERVGRLRIAARTASAKDAVGLQPDADAGTHAVLITVSDDGAGTAVTLALPSFDATEPTPGAALPEA